MKWIAASQYHKSLVRATTAAIEQLSCAELAALPFCGRLYVFRPDEHEPRKDRIAIAFGAEGEGLVAQFAVRINAKAERIAGFKRSLSDLCKAGEPEDESPAVKSSYLSRFPLLPRRDMLELLITYAAHQVLDYER